MEQHEFTSRFINSELPATRELATLLYTAALIVSYWNQALKDVSKGLGFWDEP